MSEFPANTDRLDTPNYYRGEFSDPNQVDLLRADHLFDTLEARQWINRIRVEKYGQLDMQATADKLGIPLVFDYPVIDGKKEEGRGYRGYTTGVGLRRGKEPLTIYIEPEVLPQDQRATFGHEVGHYFIDKEADVWNHTADFVQRFCEYFGREMVVDHDQLRALPNVDQAVVVGLIERYGTDHMTILYQLMSAEKLPERIILDSNIGDVPNQYFSGKVGRSVVCIECEVDAPHYKYRDGDGTPVWDFNNQNWHTDTPFKLCASRPDIATHIALNQQYGKWVPNDDLLTSSEIDRSQVTRWLIDNFYKRGDSNGIRLMAAAYNAWLQNRFETYPAIHEE